MTTYNTTQAAGLVATPQSLPTAELGYGAKKYSYLTSFTYAAQASGSVIAGPTIPKGKLLESVTLITDTSTATATLAVGNSTTAAKYKAAAAITALGVPQTSNLVPVDPPVPNATDEQILVTVGTAALPASGVLWIIANCLGI